MKLFKIVVFAAMAMVSSVSAQAAVVSSNMGANGLTDTSGTLSSDITSGALFASGFTTGSVAQQLDWVSLVVANVGRETKTVALFSDNGAGAPGSSLGTSTATTVGSKGVYTFNFSGNSLVANTQYWILPETGLKWYREANEAAPTAQNGSGFTFAGVRRSTDSGATWAIRTQRYNISVSSSDVPPPPPAVPEPALTSLLCFGGIALIRRRMKK